MSNAVRLESEDGGLHVRTRRPLLGMVGELPDDVLLALDMVQDADEPTPAEADTEFDRLSCPAVFAGTFMRVWHWIP